jgi:nitrile hydratase
VDATHVIVVENTETVHNVVVCTLCSCYPRLVLGMPPEWYKSKAYRSRVVREPRAVLKEFGTALADTVTVRVHDSNADMRYLVLPMRPPGTDGWSEDVLAQIVTRDCMVGVTIPMVPAPARAVE